jgi:hypothetical protein
MRSFDLSRLIPAYLLSHNTIHSTRLISSHITLFILPAEHYSSNQPNKLYVLQQHPPRSVNGSHLHLPLSEAKEVGKQKRVLHIRLTVKSEPPRAHLVHRCQSTKNTILHIVVHNPAEQRPLCKVSPANHHPSKPNTPLICCR